MKIYKATASYIMIVIAKAKVAIFKLVNFRTLIKATTMKRQTILLRRILLLLNHHPATPPIPTRMLIMSIILTSKKPPKGNITFLSSFNFNKNSSSLIQIPMPSTPKIQLSTLSPIETA